MEDAQHKIGQLQVDGYCVLHGRLPSSLISACREAFWPVLSSYLLENIDRPNRGAHRHFIAMPFTPPCFAPEFFFDAEILRIVQGVLGERIVADQWGCDAPLEGSTYQGVHADYQRPLFEEMPHLLLPAHMIVVSFGLRDITPEHGPMEIAPGTHRLARAAGLDAVAAGEIALESVPLALGDVLIRNPWALHRGSPNTTDTPRALLTIRYVRRWYEDSSRDVESIPLMVWESLTSAQREMMRFPVTT